MNQKSESNLKTESENSYNTPKNFNYAFKLYAARRGGGAGKEINRFAHIIFYEMRKFSFIYYYIIDHITPLWRRNGVYNHHTIHNQFHCVCPILYSISIQHSNIPSSIVRNSHFIFSIFLLKSHGNYFEKRRETKLAHFMMNIDCYGNSWMLHIRVKYLNDDASNQFHNNNNNNNHFACAFPFFLPENVILKTADGKKL